MNTLSRRYSTADESARRLRLASRTAVFLLLGLGTLLALLYLGLYAFFLEGTPGSNPVQLAWVSFFPWLAQLYQLVAWTQLPWLRSLHSGALLFVLLVLAAVCMLLAMLVGQRMVRAGLTASHLRPAFWLILVLSTCFALIMVFSPVSLTLMSRDMLLSSLYGRLVANYHLNPYVSATSTSIHDNLQIIVVQLSNRGTIPAVPFGPVWMDFSILIALLSHAELPVMLLSFRLLGLLAHLVNVALIWNLFASTKPAQRVIATLAYGWNPLVLLLSVSFVHQEVVCVLFILLAVLGLRRQLMMMSWIFALLAVLVNVYCLVLLPLFMRLLLRQTRLMGGLARLFWLLGLLAITSLMVVLAYIPYWQGWGISGIAASIGALFWPAYALNSFSVAILNLPVQLPAAVLWIFYPHHLAALLLLLLAAFLLLSLWLADTLELVVLCNSWVLLILVALEPVYWPWYSMLPLALALCSARRNVTLCAVLLALGALLAYYFWQRSYVWVGQGLVTIGVPFLLWGWALFLISALQMTQVKKNGFAPDEETGPMRLIRAPWFSRPSWSSRPRRPRVR
ncbi:MAG: hypothetical protein PVS3B1_09140 [Ktedonobacteraceae bacterium]